MADIIAGIAPRVDTHANWTSLNPTLGKDDLGKSYGQIIISTGAPEGDIMVWGNAQTYNVAYAAGQYMPAGEDITVNNLIANGDTSVQGFKRPTVVKSAAYTMTIDNYEIEVDSSGGAVTITLPDLATAIGRDFVIRKISSDSNTVTIQRAGTDTITRAGLTSVTLTSDGDWWKKHAGSTRWELVDGVESGSGYYKYPNGEAYQYGAGVASFTSLSFSNTTVTFPFSFVSTDYSGSALPTGPASNNALINTYAFPRTATNSDAIVSLNTSNNVAVTTSVDFAWNLTGKWYA